PRLDRVAEICLRFGGGKNRAAFPLSGLYRSGAEVASQTKSAVCKINPGSTNSTGSLGKTSGKP
ncbi:MAG TPA: hypothetical protein PL090_07550, partial [Syntrophales bacterium]|nr:hypothetical protein [Syntrophales bacterium]